MRNMVDIDVVLDEKYVDPKVTIQTKEKTEQVENIIYAIENVSGSDFPAIPAYVGEKIELMNPKRFLRISRSEIVNMYKVDRFDINIAGTIGIEFENGQKSWAARSRVKAIKEMIKA